MIKYILENKCNIHSEEMKRERGKIESDVLSYCNVYYRRTFYSRRLKMLFSVEMPSILFIISSSSTEDFLLVVDMPQPAKNRYVENDSLSLFLLLS